MRSLLTAWLAALVITGWRQTMRTKHQGKVIHPPPRPITLAKTSALFVLLILLYDFIPSEGKPMIHLVGWGFDLAALLQILQGQAYDEGGPWPPAAIDDSVLIPREGNTPVADVVVPGGESGVQTSFIAGSPNTGGAVSV